MICTTVLCTSLVFKSFQKYFDFVISFLLLIQKYTSTPSTVKKNAYKNVKLTEKKLRIVY